MLAETAVIDFEPVTENHMPLLERWLSQPHIQAWWGEPETELELIRSGQASGEIDAYIAHVDGEPVGYIQSWRPSEHDEEWAQELSPDTVGVDIMIGPAERIGRGIGSKVVRAFARKLFKAGVPHLVIDPDGENKRAIRAYSKAGFSQYAEHRSAEGVTVLMEMTPKTFSRMQ